MKVQYDLEQHQVETLLASYAVSLFFNQRQAKWQLCWIMRSWQRMLWSGQIQDRSELISLWGSCLPVDRSWHVKVRVCVHTGQQNHLELTN